MRRLTVIRLSDILGLAVAASLLGCAGDPKCAIWDREPGSWPVADFAYSTIDVGGYAGSTATLTPMGINGVLYLTRPSDSTAFVAQAEALLACSNSPTVVSPRRFRVVPAPFTWVELASWSQKLEAERARAGTGIQSVRLDSARLLVAAYTASDSLEIVNFLAIEGIPTTAVEVVVVGSPQVMEAF